MGKINLSNDDREFFSLVSQAAFANPFSHQRIELDRKIAGLSAAAGGPSIVPAIAEVTRRIEKLDEKGAAGIDDFKQSDHHLVRHLFLFDVFHRFVEQFDRLITEQATAGNEPVMVPFATKALSLLLKRGFSEPLAGWYFSLFYQIRRAYHFIDRCLIGQSNSMRKLRMNLWNNIFTHDISYYEHYMWNRMEDFSTLLLGPTGCGKGAAAAAIGRSGFINFDRAKQKFTESFTRTFVPVNICQYPESLLESELFGHTKGAFTGAVSSHDGLFALCSRHGSIFLDEIGEINPQVQVKLLAILEERYFCPVGSHRKIRFHGRVIAATNRDIEQLRLTGIFRDDFYYRLCSDCIMVPGLQQRIQENPGELDELMAHTVKQITGEDAEELTAAVKDVIEKRLPADYCWPGNVRELAQCVRRVIIKRDYTAQTASEDLQAKLHRDIDGAAVDAQQLLAGYCRLLYERYDTYEKVAAVTGLDRRTVKKYIVRYS